MSIISNIALWVCLVVAIFLGLVWLNTENYQPNDIPNSQFRVGVVNENNQTYSIELNKLGNETLATTPAESCRKNCLLQKNGNFIYHVDSPMKSTDSAYKIVNGKVLPISFGYFSINEGFEAFFLAFFGYAVVKYAWLRLWYRRLPDKVCELNQAYLQTLKRCLMFIAIVIGAYMVIYFLNL